MEYDKNFRIELVKRIKSEIENGTYIKDDNLEIACECAINEILSVK